MTIPISLQPLRVSLNRCERACVAAEKELLKCVRKESTLNKVWNMANEAAEHLRHFDMLMADLFACNGKNPS